MTWAFQHTSPEIGEWRSFKGMHGRLSTIDMYMTQQGGHSLVLTYTSPLSWAARDPESVFNSSDLWPSNPESEHG
jgi:hypothetical protein